MVQHIGVADACGHRGKSLRAARADDRATVRVLVVHAHALIRDAVRLALADEPSIDVVGVAHTGTGALSAAKSTDPDVVVLGNRLSDVDAPTLIAALRDQGCVAEVVILALQGEQRDVRSAVDRGARAFLTTLATSIPRLRSAVINAANGTETLSQDAVCALVNSVRQEIDLLRGQPTSRECEVWRLVAEGKTNSEIALGLFLTERTVKYHVGRLLEKTGSRSRAQLVAVAYRQGLMDGSLGPEPRSYVADPLA